MAQALRVISVQRGVDPRDFTLMAFGGAGGLHVCDLADALSIPRAAVPAYAGVLSAVGMLVAPRGRQLSQAVRARLDDCDDDALAQEFARLRARGVAELAHEGVSEQDLRAVYRVDLRYLGQSSHLTVDYRSLAASQRAFHVLHAQQFGHQMQAPVELVNLRLTLHTPPPALPLMSASQGEERLPRIAAQGGGPGLPRVWRSELELGVWQAGPSLVLDSVATTYIKAGWRACLHAGGSLLLERA
jgi:N-methylhydantoinase A